MNGWWKHILAVSLAWYLVLGVLAPRCPGEMLEVGSVNQSHATGVLKELESRLSAADAANYRESDVVSCGHYWSHALNAAVRNRHGGTTKVNAAYMPGGHSLLLPEPSNLTLSEVRNNTTKPGRVMLNTGDWNHQPLYLLDELSAYCCGAVAGIENGSRERAEQSAGFAQDVYEHCLVMARLARLRGYAHANELDAFLRYTGEYVEQLTFQTLDPGAEK